MIKKLKRLIINILCLFIPVKSWKIIFREKFLHNVFTSIKPTIKTHYGNIYSPLYNIACPPMGIPPEVYNSDGQRLNVFFIRDHHFAHDPYLNSSHKSKYILWDRYNFGLNTHFYTHDSVLETLGNPSTKYAWFFESESIVPNDYKIFDKNKGLANEFELIFTHSEKLLDKYENARFVATFARPWFGTEYGGGSLTENAYQNKTKNISIVSSYKTMCKLHFVRKNLAIKYKKENLVDTYGTFDDMNSYIKIADSLSDYRYSIVIENEISPYWFTEKITNCFASMTVPIYLGATQIDKFFNIDGIIRINIKDLDNIDKIISTCNETDYEQRLEAIKDNYKKVQKYFLPATDLFYTEYLSAKHIIC